MTLQPTQTSTLDRDPQRTEARPAYEAPTVKVMTEREILNSFQITQSMSSWWLTSCC